MEINIKNDFDIKLISTNKLIKEVENLHTIDSSAKELMVLVQPLSGELYY